MNQKIFHREEYKIFDNLANQLMKKPMIGPIGWVQVYMNYNNFINKKPDVEGNNLVVARGREFVAQKVFNLNTFDSGFRTDWRNHKISHFAVGSGGASVTNDIVSLNGPYICDTGLYQPITLGDISFLNEPSSYTAGDGIHDFNRSVKPITTDGSIILESDEYTGGGNCIYYTKMKCTCVIKDSEPSVLLPGQAVEISEAGLYFVNNADAQLFAHICFAPKWKEKESTTIIVWYILF